jgi:hypothetical protein
MIMGDMNFNMLDEQRSSVLNDLCDIFGLKIWSKSLLVIHVMPANSA